MQCKTCHGHPFIIPHTAESVVLILFVIFLADIFFSCSFYTVFLSITLCFQMATYIRTYVRTCVLYVYIRRLFFLLIVFRCVCVLSIYVQWMFSLWLYGVFLSLSPSLSLSLCFLSHIYSMIVAVVMCNALANLYCLGIQQANLRYFCMFRSTKMNCTNRVEIRICMIIFAPFGSAIDHDLHLMILGAFFLYVNLYVMLTSNEGIVFLGFLIAIIIILFSLYKRYNRLSYNTEQRKFCCRNITKKKTMNKLRFTWIISNKRYNQRLFLFKVY